VKFTSSGTLAMTAAAAASNTNFFAFM
jgi:hypothetical protein